MKKFFALVVTLLVMTFCAKAQNLLYEGFDSGTLPAGWTVIDSDGDGYNWDATTTNYAFSGAKCIASASYDNNVGVLYPDNWLISPAVDLTGDAQLIFHVRGQDPDYVAENYTVYISTTGATVADFDSVLITGTTTATYETKTVDLSAYTGETVYIAFRHHNTSNEYWLNLDEVSVFAIPTTPTIIVAPTTVNFGTTLLGDTAISTITVTGYSLTGSITATAADPFLVSADGVTYGYTATLSQGSGTLYVAYAPSMSGEETGTVTLSSTGATSVTVDLTGEGMDCSDITLPFAESFESVDALSCWTFHSNNTSNGLALANVASAGTTSLRFSSYSSASDYNQYAITPKLPLGVAKMVSFDYRSSNSTENFKVGYSTADTISLSDFTWGPVVSASNTTAWMTYMNVTIPEEAQYIAINYCSNYMYYLYVDNFSVTEVTDCMAPVSLTVSNITQNAASVNWTPVGSEIAWSVVVVEQGEDPDQGTAEYTTTRPFVVESLLPSTEYDVYVRAECESGNSPWSAAATFTTTPDCSNPSNPVVTDITGTSAVISWNAAPYGVTSYVVEYGIAESGSTEQVTVDSATTVILTALEPQTDYEYSITSICNSETIIPVPVTGTFTTGCLVGGDVTIGNGTSTSSYHPTNTCYNYSLSEQIYTAGEMGGANTLHSVAFNCSSLASSPTRNLTIYLLHTSLTSVSSSGLPMANAQQVYSGTYSFTTGWNTITFDTTFAYNGTDNLALIVDDNTGSYSCSNYYYYHTNPNGYSICFYQDGGDINPASPSASNTINNSYRANVKFGGECDETSTCVTPIITDLQYTATDATLTWQPGYQESAWTLEYKAISDTAWTSEGSVTSPHTILNLSADTRYDVRLFSDCGGELSSPATVNFTTPCATILAPYFEDFAGWNTNPSACWGRYSGLASSVFAGGALTPTTGGWIFSSSNVFPLGHPKANIYSISSKYWLVSPAIDLSAMTDPVLTFDMALTAYGSANPISDPTSQQDDQFMVIISTDNGATWNEANATIWNNQGSDRVYNSISNQGEEALVSLTQYAGQTIKIAFYGESTQSGGDNDFHIANVRVNERPTCPKPQVMVADSVAQTEIYFSWTPDGEEAAWQYICVPQGTVVDIDTVQWEFAYDTFAVASNLNANTAYTLYLRAYCDESDQSDPKTLNVRTACGLINVPFYEGFETFATGSAAAMPCWTKQSTYITGYPYVTTSNVATGTHSLYFYAGSGYYTMIVTPQFESSLALNTLQVSLNMYTFSAGSYMVLGVMTDPNDVTTFTAVDTLTTTAVQTHQFIEAPLSSYTGTGSYIALKYEPSSGNSIYVDDFSVDVIPNCPRPTSLSATSTPSDTILLNWTDAAGDLWDVIYGPTGFDPATSTEATLITGLTETSCAVSGLTGGVTYDFYVRSDCGGGEVSNWNFAPATASPYTITMGITGSDTVTACGITISDDGGIGGNYSNNCNYTLVIYPSDPDSLLVISGTFAGESSYDYLEIYDGVGTANLINKVSASLYNQNSGVTFPFGPFTSESGPITLRFYSDGSSTYEGFAANVACIVAPSCRRPINFVTTGNTSSTVSLSWTEQGDATAWNVVYGPAGFTPSDTSIVVPVTDNTTTITDLTEGTAYDFYVQSDCGGEVSEWAGPVSVTPGTFNMSATGTQTITMCGGIIYDNGGVNSNYSSNCSSTLTVMPDQGMLVQVQGTYDLESCCDHLTIYDGTSASGTPLWQHTYSSGQSGTIPMLESTTGPITLYFTSDGSAQYSGFALTVSCVVAPTCMKPTNVTVSGSTTTTADISWTEMGTATTWNIEYGPTGFTQGQGTLVSATTNPYTLTGLTAATTYDVYVQADCGGGDVSDWSSVVTVTTLPCDDACVYTINMSDQYGDGWNGAYITVTTSLGAQTVTLSGGAGSANVILCPGDSMLLSWNTGSYDDECSFTVEDASGTILYTCTDASSLGSGTFFSTSCGDVPPTPTCNVPTNVAASNVTYNSASINWTAGGNETAWNLQYKKANQSTWSNSIAVTSRPYTLSNLDAETAYNVRVQANCGADGTSDWSTVANFTTAAAPTDPCDDPTGLTVGNITAHTAVATWTAGGDETAWNVQYKQTGASAWNSAAVNTPTYTIEGLTPQTGYTIQVQAVCSETNLSNWVSATFTTLVDGISSVELANSISIMPNPAESYIELTVNSNVSVKEAAIYNAFGQMIQKVTLTDNHARIDVSGMAAGMYFVRIANDNNMATKKFIKK